LCEAFNSAGMISRRFRVEVQDRIRSRPIIVPNVLLNQTVDVNSTVNFTCQVISDLVPHIVWIKLTKKDGSCKSQNIQIYNKIYNIYNIFNNIYNIFFVFFTRLSEGFQSHPVSFRDPRFDYNSICFDYHPFWRFCPVLLGLKYSICPVIDFFCLLFDYFAPFLAIFAPFFYFAPLRRGELAGNPDEIDEPCLFIYIYEIYVLDVRWNSKTRQHTFNFIDMSTHKVLLW
jgi:hypothetical protein